MLEIFEIPPTFDIFRELEDDDSIGYLKYKNDSVSPTKNHQNFKKKINLNNDSIDRSAYIAKIKKKIKSN